MDPNADPGIFGGKYWTVTITSPTTGEKQQWLLQDVASNRIALRSHQSDDLTGADHGYYYQWNGGADLTISEINSLTSTSGFQIPDMDDIYKLDRIVGSHQEAVVALNLTFDGNYVPGSNTWHYNTDYLCFWLNMDNDNYPDAGVFYQIDKEDYNGKIVYTNVESMRCNLRLVRDLN